MSDNYALESNQTAKCETVETAPHLERRGGDRFHIPGAMTLIARRNLLGVWKNATAPYHVCDICSNGLSFRNFGEELKVGTNLRMTILLPERPPVNIRAKVIWNRELPADVGRGACEMTHQCGVKILDYGPNAWNVLSNLQTPLKAKLTRDLKNISLKR